MTQRDRCDEAMGDPAVVDGLVQLSFAVHSILGRVAAAHELSMTQLRLLGILRDREPGMMQLAELLGLDKSSVTGLVDRAERRGLVRRASRPADGRAVRVASRRLAATSPIVAARRSPASWVGCSPSSLRASSRRSRRWPGA